MPKKITRLRRTIFQGGMYASPPYFCSSRERSVFYVFILTPGVGVLTCSKILFDQSENGSGFCFSADSVHNRYLAAWQMQIFRRTTTTKQLILLKGL